MRARLHNKIKAYESERDKLKLKKELRPSEHSRLITINEIITVLHELDR